MKKYWFSGVLFTLIISVSFMNFMVLVPDKSDPWLVEFEGFQDAIHHWQNKHGNNYSRYKKDDFTAIANNLLLYQKNNGGWIENQDPLRILSRKEQKELIRQKSNVTVSLDNRNMYSQIEYLYGVYKYTMDKKYQEASLKGLELLLSLQHPGGGWPHTFPASKTYHSHVTLADEVTSGVLNLMYNIEKRQHPFQDIPELYHKRAVAARKAGTDCLLSLQIKQNGCPAIWAGQYDSATLTPAVGRSYELASLASWESVAVIRYLMRIQNPSSEMINAIETAVQWLDKNRIKGYKIEEIPLLREYRFDFHKADFDRKWVRDENAPDIWARFYDIKTSEILLANRDGRRVKSYEEIEIERRTGYQWYGYWPASLIETDYPAWKERLGR